MVPTQSVNWKGIRLQCGCARRPQNRQICGDLQMDTTHLHLGFFGCFWYLFFSVVLIVVFVPCVLFCFFRRSLFVARCMVSVFHLLDLWFVSACSSVSVFSFSFFPSCRSLVVSCFVCWLVVALIVACLLACVFVVCLLAFVGDWLFEFRG